MKKLDQNAVNDVLKTDEKDRIEVLFKFLVEGKSHRAIENEKPTLAKNDGWSSWKITQFYGFGNNDKGRFPSLKFEKILHQTTNINLDNFAEFHLENEIIEEEKSDTEGKDILKLIKIRIGQARLRKSLLEIYENKCALCEINTKSLLVTSHIKPWSKSTPNEKVDLENSILLCKLHDGLFENGLIAFDDYYNIIYKDKENLEKQGINTNLKFRVPNQKSPSQFFLKFHRDNHKIINKASR